MYLIIKNDTFLNWNPYNKGKINIITNQQQYLSLTRLKINDQGPLGVDYNKTLQPTLVLSLFSNIDANNINAFVNGIYFMSQILLIIKFKCSFPEGNLILYLEKQMCDIMKTIDIQNINYIIDINKMYKLGDVVSNLIRNEYDVLVKDFNKFINDFNEKSYENFFEYFVNMYIKASCIQIKKVDDKHKYSTYGNYSDIYIYEFKKPFIEKYLGQYIRILQLAQMKYKYNNNDVHMMKHLIFKDGHHSIPSQYDIDTIRKINQTEPKKMYFLPLSLQYVVPWHGYIKHDDKHEQRGINFGLQQFCNFDDEPRESYDVLRKTILYPFILLDVETINGHTGKGINYIPSYMTYTRLTLDKKICDRYDIILPLYKYGFDEYMTMLWLNCPEVQKRSIYFWFHYNILSNHRDIIKLFVNNNDMNEDYAFLLSVYYDKLDVPSDVKENIDKNVKQLEKNIEYIIEQLSEQYPLDVVKKLVNDSISKIPSIYHFVSFLYFELVSSNQYSYRGITEIDVINIDNIDVKKTFNLLKKFVDNDPITTSLYQYLNVESKNCANELCIRTPQELANLIVKKIGTTRRNNMHKYLKYKKKYLNIKRTLSHSSSIK